MLLENFYPSRMKNSFVFRAVDKMVLRSLTQQVFKLRGIYPRIIRGDETELRVNLFDHGLGLLKEIADNPYLFEQNEKKLKLAQSCIKIATDDPHSLRQIKSSRPTEINDPSPEYEMCYVLPTIILSLSQKKPLGLQQQKVLKTFLKILNDLSRFSSSKYGLAYHFAEQFLIAPRNQDFKNVNLDMSLLQSFMTVCRGSLIVEMMEH